jgi:uncharacterized membrane protein
VLSPRSPLLLAGLLSVTGTTHLVAPHVFDPLVPDALPGRSRAWTYGSGVAELAVAAALALPRTRRWGGLAAAGLFVGVLPGNIKMALDSRARSRGFQAASVARLPLQVPLVAWGLRIFRRPA